MSDPARNAERARVARLLYTRLDPAERARLEAEYAALADPPQDAAGSTATQRVAVSPVVEQPLLEPVAPRMRRFAIVIGASVVLAMGVGVAAGWSFAPRGAPATERRQIAASEVPSLFAPSAAAPAPATGSALLDIFYRSQVVTADDSSDIPPVDVGDAYESETFRHLVMLTSAGADGSVVGNAYAAVRAIDHEICLVIVSRTAFVADSCVDADDVPDSGISVSVRVRSALYAVSWLGSGGVEVSASR